MSSSPRAVLAMRIGGLAAGIAASVAIGVLASIEVAIVLIPAIIGLTLLIGTTIGEAIRLPRHDGDSLPLRPAAVLAAVPRALSIASLAGLTAIIAALITTSATAHGANTLQQTCTSGAPATATGWPGSATSIPLATVILIALIAVGAGLVLSIRRPRGSTISDEVPVARAQSLNSRRIVEGFAAFIGLTLGGVSLAAGTTLVNLGCAPLVLRVLGWSLLVVAIGALLAGLMYVARLLFGPAGRQRRHSAG